MNLIVLIIGIVMAIATTVIWGYEIYPFLVAIKALQYPRSNKGPLVAMADSLRFIAQFCASILKLWVIVLDLIITFFLTGIFLGGGGLFAGVIGLTLSNLVSGVLLYSREFVKSEIS